MLPGRFTALVVLLLLGSKAVAASPGDLDLTFAGTGYTRIAMGHGDDYPLATVDYPGSRILIAGRCVLDDTGIDFCLLRLNADGSPDASFGTAGRVVTSFTSGSDTPLAVTVQSDGKIVVAGYAGFQMAVARYLADGALDTSFDGDGLAILVPGEEGEINAVTTSGTQILLAGTIDTGGFYRMALIRLNADGSMDSTFDGDGLATTAALGFAGAQALTGQSEGKIVLAGWSSTTSGGTRAATIARFTASGQLDPTFDGDGIATRFIGSGGAILNAVGILVTQPPRATTLIVAAGSSGLGLPTRDALVMCFLLSGALDTNFDGDGIAAPSLGSGDDDLTSLRIQPAGLTTAARILVAGSAKSPTPPVYNFAVCRLTRAGGLDPSFDGDGIAVTPVGLSHSYARGMYLTASTAVVVGYAYNSLGDWDFATVRYLLSNGALDATFDGDGKRMDDVGNTSTEGDAMAVQPDGRVIVAGSVNQKGMALARLNPDGSLDSTFSGTGQVSYGLPGFSEVSITGLAVQPDGRIVACGFAVTTNTEYLLLARFLSNGAFDPSFDGDGWLTSVVMNDDAGYAVAIQADGRIVVAGFSTSDPTATQPGHTHMRVSRYLPNGTPDASFGTGGHLTDLLGGYDAVTQAVAIQGDGRIVLAGTVFAHGFYEDMVVARLNPNGTFDPSFNGNGRAVFPISGSFEKALAVAIQPDGRIVIAGSATAGSTLDPCVVRVNANGSLDTSFDGDGRATIPLGSDGGYIRSLVVLPDGRIAAAGLADYSGFSGNKQLVMLLHADGTLDPSWGGLGYVKLSHPPFPSSAWAVALDPTNGTLLVAGQLGGRMSAARFQGYPVTAVPEVRPGSAGLRLSAPWPNPTRSASSIEFELPATGQVTLQLFDASGRLVRRLLNHAFVDAGSHLIQWDGRDASGELVGSGVYFVRAEGPGGAMTRQITRTR